MEEIINDIETLEEMEAKYKALGEKIKKQKQAEADRKRAQLALDKEKRKKAIEEKERELSGLIRDYIKDYGSYCSTRYKVNDDTGIWSLLHDLFFFN